MSNFNFRNLKPLYVEQDQFNWSQNNNIPADKELVEIYFYKALNLTNNGLQIFKEASQTLLQLTLDTNKIVIKGKPLIANGALTLKPTYENMIANIAFAEQPEFMVFDPIIASMFGGQSVKPTSVVSKADPSGATTETYKQEQAVGTDMYFVRLETKNENNKATWYIISSIQTQVNTDNTFSTAKIRLTPFNQSLLPQNIKLQFQTTSAATLVDKPVKYVKITTKPYSRIGNQRIIGTQKDPRTTLEIATAQTWNYEKDPQGAIMIKEYPIQVSGQTVIWKSDWLEQNQVMWNQTKDGVNWDWPQFWEDAAQLAFLLNYNKSWDKHNSDAGRRGYPVLTVDAATYNFPLQDGEGNSKDAGDIDKSEKLKPWQHAVYNHEDITRVMGQMGKRWETHIGVLGIGDRQEIWNQKVVNYNPFFTQRSAYQYDCAYAVIETKHIPNATQNILSLGLEHIFTSKTDDRNVQAWRTSTNGKVPDFKTRLASLMQDRSVQNFISPVRTSDLFANFKTGITSAAFTAVQYTELPQEKLDTVSGSNINSIDPDNADDHKYIWMTKSLYYDADQTNKNRNYPEIKFGDIGYATGTNTGMLSTYLDTAQKIFFKRDFGDDDKVGDVSQSDRSWVDEDLTLVRHMDWWTYKGLSSQFTSQQLRNIYNITNDQYKTNIPSDLVQEIVLDTEVYAQRFTFIYGAGCAGQEFKIEYQDINRNTVYTVNGEFPVDETISQYTVATL